MKMYAIVKIGSYRNLGYVEVVRTTTQRWPSGWFETYVFIDGHREKAEKCEACYVFQK